MIIYDCEIIKAIPPKDPRDRVPGIEYCEGWGDFYNMGISCIGLYDYSEDRYCVFLEDNFPEFQERVDNTDLVIGFNSLRFDNMLARATGLYVPDEKSYDILKEVWEGAGYGPKFNFKTHTGYGLDRLCKVNFDQGKSGNGALAPIDWQQGQRGRVIDYCLRDVWLTKKLMDRILRTGSIVDPKNIGSRLMIQQPPILKAS